MDTFLSDFEKLAARVRFAPRTIPVASTLTGQIVRSGGTFNAKYLRQQAREPVDYVKAVTACQSEALVTDSSVVFEVGPNPVCINLIASILVSASPSCFTSLQYGKDGWHTISQCLAGAYIANLPISWPAFHKDYLTCLQLLNLPTYAFDLKNYWQSYQNRSKAGQIGLLSFPTQDRVSNFSTTCLRMVETISEEDGHLEATFSSKTSEPNLFRALQGHLVNGIPI